MGKALTKYKEYYFGEKEVKIFIHGLQEAGKSTLLRKLNLAKVSFSCPALGMFTEHVFYKDVDIKSWDVGGRCSDRAMYRYYHNLGADAVLFVVDSSDTDSYTKDMNRQQLQMLLEEEELQNTIFLILANKQDVPHAATGQEIEQALDIDSFRKTHNVKVMECSAETGEGLFEALDWLSNELHLKSGLTGKEDEDKMIAKKSEEQKKKEWSFKSLMKGCFGSVMPALSRRG